MDGNAVAAAVDAAATKGAEFAELPVEIKTDKDRVKAVACPGCARPLIVSTFAVPAQARCSECKGEAADGSVVAPSPGKTDPAKVRDLASVLINPAFAHAVCPIDSEHEMELKSVSHSEHHGPGEWRLKDGQMLWIQIAPGETVMHQCNDCRATVAYSTTARHTFRRQNETKAIGAGADGWKDVLGVRGGLAEQAANLPDQPEGTIE